MWQNEAEKFFRSVNKWQNACFAQCGTTGIACGLSDKGGRRRDAVPLTCVAFRYGSAKKGIHNAKSIVSLRTIQAIPLSPGTF